MGMQGYIVLPIYFPNTAAISKEASEARVLCLPVEFQVIEQVHTDFLIGRDATKAYKVIIDEKLGQIIFLTCSSAFYIPITNEKTWKPNARVCAAESVTVRPPWYHPTRSQSQENRLRHPYLPGLLSSGPTGAFTTSSSLRIWRNSKAPATIFGLYLSTKKSGSSNASTENVLCRKKSLSPSSSGKDMVQMSVSGRPWTIWPMVRPLCDHLGDPYVNRNASDDDV